ncbi:MAG: glycosyltransferase family 4 protein [Gemmataceae bacterium]
MRVVFNSLATLKPKTGVGHYAARLADALSRQLPSDEFSLFPGPKLAGWVRSVRNSGATKRGTSGRGLRPWLKDKVKSLGLHAVGAVFRFQCHPGRFDLYHEPNFLPLESSLPTVITVHDLSVLLHPEWHPADRVRRHEAQFRLAVERAAHVITVSESVRSEVIKVLGLPASRVTPIHNGVGVEYFNVPAQSIAAVREKHDLPDTFLLYVGTIEPRKNLLTLLRAYCNLPGDVRSRCPLILAGGWGWHAEPIAEYLFGTALGRGVRHLGYVADDDLPGLYAAARALVFPSHYEGFGLPPLEMLATGGLVIASTAAAHVEVLGKCATFVAPEDVIGWRDAMNRVVCDEDWLASLPHDGPKRASTFTWERSARQTIAVYDQIQSTKKLAA